MRIESTNRATSFGRTIVFDKFNEHFFFIRKTENKNCFFFLSSKKKVVLSIKGFIYLFVLREKKRETRAAILFSFCEKKRSIQKRKSVEVGKIKFFFVEGRKTNQQTEQQIDMMMKNKMIE